MFGMIQRLSYLWDMNETNTPTMKHEAIIRTALSRTTDTKHLDVWTSQAIDGPTTENNAAVIERKLHIARHGSARQNMAPMTANEKRTLTAAMKHYKLGIYNA